MTKTGTTSATRVDGHDRDEDVTAILDALTDLDTLYRSANRPGDVPESTLLALLRRGTFDMRHHAAGHQSATSSVLAVAARDAIFSIRLIAATNELTPPEALAAMTRDRSAQVLHAVVQNPSTPIEARSEVVRRGDTDVQRAGARMPLTDDTLEQLVRSRRPMIREAVVTNPCLTEALAERLANDKRPSVRQALARACTFPRVLLQLAGDDRLVARAVASNQAASMTVLERCLDHPDVDVRRRVAERDRLPSGLMLRLATDPRAAVRAAMARRSDVGPYRPGFVSDPSHHVRRALAMSDQASRVELDELCRDRTSSVRDTALRNRNTSPEFLREAAEHPDVRVRRTARTRLAERGERIERPKGPVTLNTDLAQLLLWAETESDPVRLARAMDDEAMPLVVRRTLLQRIPLHDSVFEAAARSSEVALRKDAASHVDCPQHVLQQLCADENPWVRRRAVRGPKRHR